MSVGAAWESSTGVVAPDRKAFRSAVASAGSSTTAIFHFVASSAAKSGPAEPACASSTRR